MKLSAKAEDGLHGDRRPRAAAIGTGLVRCAGDRRDLPDPRLPSGPDPASAQRRRAWCTVRGSSQDTLARAPGRSRSVRYSASSTAPRASARSPGRGGARLGLAASPGAPAATSSTRSRSPSSWIIRRLWTGSLSPPRRPGEESLGNGPCSLVESRRTRPISFPQEGGEGGRGWSQQLQQIGVPLIIMQQV